MLGEGFLRVLLYREERKFASASHLKASQTHNRFLDPSSCDVRDPTDLQSDSAEAGPNEEEQDLQMPQSAVGLSIPGSTPVLSLNPDFTAYLDNCSLLQQYPDLQVADSGRITHNPLRTIVSEDSKHGWSAQQEPQGQPFALIPNQEYMVMGAGGNNSLDLPGSGLEPMSNSVLNGILDKQLEEVYMQHLTDNLARCNSHLGNSLLHGLVPPPQPSTPVQGLDSLEASLEAGSEGDSGKKISYLNTHNFAPCSSNFSSPVLRISEAENTHVQ